ncbi:carboxy terminal-processing peptidase [Duganella violaceipulchra]|uniref:Carboxy terminal-processing peptidase n=1 Tax=Duganella violaceipulchra TaxID=2849652 RepID=A0AA41H798_9BURK|nr:carboxy terminal-processing peptidase [Duganella violaceicalia]MBV6323362.1 carboxy terminal-processing peptidase [Duganella violaceicalia]MCP2007684.1 carboxyl-terminal processing protease [Duganella violaceicalia]
MKKQILLVAVLAALSVQAGAAVPEKAAAETVLKPQPGQAQAAVWASRVLTKLHYKSTPLDDAMSEKIFDRYFKSLDSEKLFFTQADLDQYAIVRTRLDDAITGENLSVPFAIYNQYQQRFNERIAYARELLKTKPDFSLDESYQYDREKAEWVKSDAEMKELWRKRVKNDWLRLKLAGKDDKGIRDTLDKRYENYVSRSRKLTNEDVFQIFMNAYAMSIEPHTNYLGPRAAENFDIAMRLSLEGIGCVLQTRDEYTVVREVVPGSPAGLSGKIKVGDKILGVAKDDKSPMTEVLGWRIDDVVALIRGPKDSTVRLDIQPVDAGVDGKHTTISLVRKKISMEEQSAKKSILEVKDGTAKRRIGVISLPTFYQDFEASRKGDKEYKSATRDVARLLGELKKEKVDNVLIDLRNNGGGSLSEAVQLTGLFIDKGPVVQQRTGDNKIEVESDTNAGMAWDGPLGVLINRGSASASEIFAAAIQDYGRGVIIGEPSFGKGTVQTIFGLDRFAQNDKVHYGELKMTIAQFFRINGGTTQLRGVTPDIKLPTMGDSDTFGESSYDNALPWTSIAPAPYIPTGDLKDILPLLDKKHEARVAKDKDFQYLSEDIALVKKQRKDNLISLNETLRRKERDTQEARAKLREARLLSTTLGADDPVLLPDPKDALNKAISAKPANGKAAPSPKVAAVKGALRTDDGLQGDERSLTAELDAEKAAKAAKDVLLNEAVHILADEVGFLKTDTRMASRVLPYAVDASK